MVAICQSVDSPRTPSRAACFPAQLPSESPPQSSSAPAVTVSGDRPKPAGLRLLDLPRYRTDRRSATGLVSSRTFPSTLETYLRLSFLLCRRCTFHLSLFANHFPETSTTSLHRGGKLGVGLEKSVSRRASCVGHLYSTHLAQLIHEIRISQGLKAHALKVGITGQGQPIAPTLRRGSNWPRFPAAVSPMPLMDVAHLKVKKTVAPSVERP